MPGHAGGPGPYWAAVDFDSEGEDNPSPHSNRRVYLDPWDNDGNPQPQDRPESSSHGENYNSFIGEPVSASFYYVPTKNYDEEETIKRMPTPPEIVSPDYGIYTKKPSRIIPHVHHDMPIYGCDRIIREKRRSMYAEEPIYPPHPMIYEPLYGPVVPPPGYLPPRSRLSLAHHPDYVVGPIAYPKKRRHSRLTDVYEHMTYESLAPEYEDWARAFPKAAPDNFHLSRYGHLQIDYSCSWNSLDRLIRNQ